MFSSEEKLAIEITHVNCVQVNLNIDTQSHISTIEHEYLLEIIAYGKFGVVAFLSNVAFCIFYVLRVDLVKP